jgi:ParB-like chromosome segregation protein Spo0J
MQIVELNLSALDERYGRLRVVDRRRRAQMLASVEEHGQRDAIRVVAEGEGRFVVIDGYERVRALRRLRRDVVKAVVLAMRPAEALAAVYREGLARGYNAIEEGFLVYELHRVWKWDLGKAAASMGRSRSWASRRLGLVEALPDTVLEGVRCGKLGAWSAMKHLLPLARANGPACERLAGKIIKACLSSRDVGLVCAHFAKSGATVGERILEDPVRFLKALEAAGQGSQEPGLSQAENRALKQLEIVGNVTAGLICGLPRVLGYDTGPAARAALWAAWTRAAKRWRVLEETAAALKAAEGKIVKEVRRDQSGTTDGRIDPARAGPQQPQNRQGPGAGTQCGPGDHRQRTSTSGDAAGQAAQAGALC